VQVAAKKIWWMLHYHPAPKRDRSLDAPEHVAEKCAGGAATATPAQIDHLNSCQS